MGCRDGSLQERSMSTQHLHTCVFQGCDVDLMEQQMNTGVVDIVCISISISRFQHHQLNAVVVSWLRIELAHDWIFNTYVTR